MAEGRPQSLTALSEDARAAAMDRWTVLRPTIEDGVPLARSAAAAGVAPSTARRWLTRYEAGGLAALARRPRSDSGVRKTRAELVALIEGLALRRPAPSTATIARRIAVAANERGWPAPSYSTVAAIVAAIDPAVVSLAHDGPDVFRDHFELVFRRRAARPNDIWQADHTELDLLVLDADGCPARPWLTLILDDHSRAVAGYSVFLGAPSALNLSLALRQAVWMKPDPGWPVHGLPDVLHVDHGSDFTSRHIEQVAVDLHIQLVYSAIARPQGRGKVERLFGTVTQELLPDFPGHLVRGKPASPSALSLAQLDAAIGKWITETYHQRAHQELGATPLVAWLADGWLPRRPQTLADLDLLLVMVAKARVVHRDGIRFQGLRYFDPTLAGYVGRAVTIRFDPRDLSQVRVFLDDRFLCRAVSPEHAGDAITLKDVQAARIAHRRAARARIADGRAAVAEYLPRGAPEAPRPRPRSVPTPRWARAASCTPTPRMPRAMDDAATRLRRRTGEFIATKEHRRFVEFANAVRREAFIGLCFGPAGVGKTLSARRYAHWDAAEDVFYDWGARLKDGEHQVSASLARSRTIFYTPAVKVTYAKLVADLDQLLMRADILIDDHVRKGIVVSRGRRLHHVQLIVIDEAERLSAPALEDLRDRFDRRPIGLLLIGMPGLEKRFAAFPQLYSRIGFAHQYRPLTDEELAFVLARHWRKLGLTLDLDDFTDAQAITAISRITRGNFRLLHRLFTQVARIMKINDLTVITTDVIEAARSTLVIGTE